MEVHQSGILAPLPAHGRYLSFVVNDFTAARRALSVLASVTDGEHLVVGLSATLVQSLGTSVTGLTPFPACHAGEIVVPASDYSLWCWLRGAERGELLHRSLNLEKLLAPAFHLDQCVDAFCYAGGRDLTGYQDGTENPKDEDALVTAFLSSAGRGLDGSSFVAVQQWQHDFSVFDAMSSSEQDNSVGRRSSDNEELDDAPASAHVKRTAQESFSPEAFVVRRSMPWIEGQRSGLMFVAFAHSFAAFDAQLKRMTGAEDGVVDALFRFTRPLTGAYFWCPPMKDGQLDLSLLER
jgi:porphyrinogen peroxidase